MKRKTTIIISLVFVLLAAFFLKNMLIKPDDNSKGKSGKEKAIQKVDAFIVKPTRLITEITVNGSLVSYDEVTLQNEVAGRVVQINLPEGQFVKKGTLLVKLFDDDLQASYKKLQSQLMLQEQLAKRQSELVKVNGISQNEYDQTLLQINAIKADIEIEKTRIRKTEVLAPFDGVIGLRNISVGAIVTPATMLATIRSSDNLKLDFYVPEKYGYEIKQGMKVNFSLYNSDKKYTATVFATEKNIDNSTRNLKVRALVNSRSAELISGAFANVVLQLNETQGALLVPTQAVIPNEEQKNVIVARDGKAHFADVKTGIRQASKIEIVSGINAGDTIITTGILFLSEGKPLKYSTVTH